MNFTDVDDKTIAASQQAGVSLRDYTDRFVAAFLEDAAALGLEAVEENPRATDEANLRAMVDMIGQLEARGHTYRSDGSIYYRIATLPGYGKLARLDHDGMQAGARVDADSYAKQDARDFVLAASSTSPVASVTPGLSASARASLELGSRTSATTSCPRSHRAATTFDPRKPVAPVTKMRADEVLTGRTPFGRLAAARCRCS
jgi:hypothetical protein